MKRLSGWIGILSLLLGSAACHIQGQVSHGEDLPSREVLRRNFRQADTILVVYGTQNPAHVPGYQDWVAGIETQSRRTYTWIQADTAIQPELGQRYPLFLIGSPSNHSWVEGIAQKIGLHFQPEGFQWQNRSYSDSTYLFQLSFYPNPQGGGMPVFLFTGQDDAAILNRLAQAQRRSWGGLPWSGWGYQIWWQDKRVLLGQFNEDWRCAHDQEFAFDPSPTPILSRDNLEIYRYGENWTAAQSDSVALRAASLRERASAFIEVPISTQTSLHLHASEERMGLMTGNMAQAWFDPDKKQVHLLANDRYRGLASEQEIAWLLNQNLGTASQLALFEGLATYLTPDWQGRGYDPWAAALFRGNFGLSMAQLMDEKAYTLESPLVRSCQAAAWVDFLIQTWGKEQFLAQYRQWTVSARALRQLEREWRRYQLDLANRSTPLPDRRSSLPYLRGMTFAHEGYQVYNGYGSSLAQASLQRLAEMDVNCVALVPYSGMRDPKQAQPLRFSIGANGENDASVVFAHHHIQALNMLSLLKPQIWIRGAWPGDVNMSNAAEWKQFFHAYRRWILHYALLGEIHQMDILCIGVEFLKVSTRHPEFWDQLTRDLRPIFKGQLTYAANWGEEIESLRFASSLDFVGVNCYYPLSKDPQAGEAELRAGFASVGAKMKALSETYQKPFVLTEIGFRPIPATWVSPHAHAPDNAPLDLEAQAKCYRIVLEGLQGETWCQGLVWWKWPSFMDYSERNPHTFAPNDRPAAEVLEQFYGNWSN